MNKLYTYRSKDGSKIVQREFELFEEPETIKEGSDDLYKVVDQATPGWTHYTYRTEDEKTEIQEFWKHNTAPESFTRGGVLYKMVFGVPTLGDGMRMGSGLMGKTSKSFQDIMKNIHKKNPGSRLNENL